MKVCVTGAAGYIGGWLLRELDARGHEVHAQDLVRPNASGSTWQTFRRFDLESEQRLTWLKRYSPDVVIHLAALYGRVWGEVDKVRTATVNAGLTAALATDVASVGARLMYMSSSEVYGRAAERRNVGVHCRTLAPMNMYGYTKLWGEQAAQLYAPDGLMVTRLNMPYGPSVFLPKVGERPATSGRPGTVGYNVLHSMLWEAEHGHPLIVHRGTKRCLTWCGDTVRGLVDIMESGREGTWNVSRNDDHHNLIDIARQVVELTGSKSSIHLQPAPERVTLRKSLDNAELRALGWEPRVSLEEGMKHTYDYFRKFDRNGVWCG